MKQDAKSNPWNTSNKPKCVPNINIYNSIATEICTNYNLNSKVRNRITGCLPFCDINEIKNTIEYIISLMEKYNQNIFTTNDILYNVFAAGRFPSASEIETKLLICLSIKIPVIEALSSSFIISLDNEALYSEVALFKKGRNQMSIDSIKKLDILLGIKRKEGIRKMYPLDKKALFVLNCLYKSKLYNPTEYAKNN